MAASPSRPRQETRSARPRQSELRPHGSATALRTWSQRQLDAYLIARDTLRRIRTMASLAAPPDQGANPPVARA